jgi:tetratricopeptide (TPR) repeat protein
MANKAKTALLCAYTLAHAKQYAEAEALILSHEDLAKTPEALDLLARIRMEEGDEPEARRLWQSILTIYPENKAARAALGAIGKKPLRINWIAVLVALLPAAFLGGGFLGASFLARTATPPPQVVTVEWDNIPTQAKISELAPYKGATTRVCIASHFFSAPDKLFSRELLADAVGKALELPATAIFIGEASESMSDTAIRVELMQQ